MGRGLDPVLTYWKAFATFKEGAVTEAIHELGKIQSKRDLQFAVFLALAYYHRSCNIVDQDAVAELDSQLASSEKAASENGLIISAQFLNYIGEAEKAKKLLNALIDKSSGEGANIEAHSMIAWIDLQNPGEVQYPDIEQSLSALLDPNTGGNNRHMGTLLAMAKVLEMERKIKDALNILSDISVTYKTLLPALLERIKLLIQSNEWEQVQNIMQKAMSNKYATINCNQVQIFQLLARDGNRQEAIEKLKELYKIFDSYEPKNPEVYYKLSQLFARISGGNDFILQRCMELIKRSISLNPSSSRYLTEEAYQLTLMQEFAQAFQIYQKAAELDETNMEALYGMIYCRIKQNLLEDIESQLQFLTELENNKGCAFHSFLEAMILFRRDGNVSDSTEVLNKCLKMHIGEAKLAQAGFEFYIKLNSAFMIELAQEYLQHCPASKKFSGADGLPTYLIKGTKLLETLTKQTPGILEARMLLAKAKWISGDISSAQNALNTCITMAPDNVEIGRASCRERVASPV